MNESFQVDQNGYFMTDTEREQALDRSLTGVFTWMFIGLIISTFAAWAVLSSEDFVYRLFYSSPFLYIGLIIAELVVVFVLTRQIYRMSSGTAMVMFGVYALLNGITLSYIFLIYEIGTIAVAFLAAAGMFGATALYGAITKRSLHSIGSYALMGLFGIIIASILNWFFLSETLDMIICYVGILIFLALTAYDTQQVRKMLYQANSDQAVQKVKIIGALALYLDFINIFLKLLRILARRRD